jgi:hypothetical protein
MSHTQTLHRYSELPTELRDMILEFVVINEKGTWDAPWEPVKKGFVPEAAHTNREMRAQILPILYKTSEISIPHCKLENWNSLLGRMDNELHLRLLIHHINLIQRDECGCRQQIQIYLGRGQPFALSWDVIEHEMDELHGEDWSITKEGHKVVTDMYRKGMVEAAKSDPGKKVRAKKNMITFDFGGSFWGWGRRRHFVALDQWRNKTFHQWVGTRGRNEIIKYLFEEMVRQDVRIEFQGRKVRECQAVVPEGYEIDTKFANGWSLLEYARELSYVMGRDPEYHWFCSCDVNNYDYRTNVYIDRIEVMPQGYLQQEAAASALMGAGSSI